MSENKRVGECEARATKELNELEKQHEGLTTTLTQLKEDVQSWQCNIEQEANEHKKMLDEIRQKLKEEVEALRTEFLEIKKGMQAEIEEMYCQPDNS